MSGRRGSTQGSNGFRFCIKTRVLVIVAALAMSLGLGSTVIAADSRCWIGSNGYWSDAAQWDTGVPVPLDRAYLNASGASVIFDSDYSTSDRLEYVEVDNDSILYLLNDAGTLSAGLGPDSGGGGLVLGNTGNGTLTQSGGTVYLNATFGALVLGSQSGSTGTYNLDYGTLTVVGYEEMIGQLGKGCFNQYHGLHEFGGAMYIGTGEMGSTSSSAEGYYAMHGGELRAIGGQGGIAIGEWGAKGVFSQWDGTVDIRDLTLGRQVGSTGQYDLIGGSITVSDWESVGTAGTGTFTQTGGTNETGSLYVGGHDIYGSGAGTGTYTLDAPVPQDDSSNLQVLSDLFVGDGGIGTFTHEHGRVTVDGSLVLGRQGAGIFYGEGTYSLNNDELMVKGSTFVGWDDGCTGTFNQTGGMHSANGLVLGQWAGSSGTYDLSGDGYVSISSDIYIGVEGTGHFAQNGNSTVEANNLFLATAGGSGSYELNGGELILHGAGDIGFNSKGAFTQGGGTNTVEGALSLGVTTGGDGTYTLDGGELTASNVFVGDWGMGTFIQDHGTQYVGMGPGKYVQDGLHELIVGRNGGSEGSFSLLMDGQLYAKHEVVGDAGGTGRFDQSGQSYHYVHEDLIIGQDGDGDGTNSLEPDGAFYLRESAVLDVIGSLILGDMGGFGLFEQGEAGNAGDTALTVGGSLRIGAQSEGENSDFMSVGGYSQYGGTVKVTGDLQLGESAGTRGLYALEGGSLDVLSAERIGISGEGVFEQSGGTHTVYYDLVLANNPGGSGRYTLEGGDLHVGYYYDAELMSYTPNPDGASIFVGMNGAGTFTQSGGTVTINGGLALGQEYGSSGEYDLSSIARPEDSVLIVTGHEHIGILGAGTFRQASGLHFIGGDLVLGNDPAGMGTFNMDGGRVVVDGIADIGMNGTGVRDIDGNLIQAGGTFNQTGGTLAVRYYDLNIGQCEGSTGAYNLGGTGFVSVGRTLYVGLDGNGTFTQDGAASRVEVAGGVLIASSGADSSLGEGVYNLVNGTLSSDYLLVGGSNNGTFHQTGGTSETGGVILGGYGNGTYQLEAGDLFCEYLIAGDHGQGKVAQSGGTITTVYDLVVGNLEGSEGTYDLSGNGVVNVGQNLMVGNWDGGNGTFTQSGGDSQVNVTEGLWIANNTARKSSFLDSYTLNDGTLNTLHTIVGSENGAGKFIQNGGHHAVTNLLALGNTAGSTGEYDMSYGYLTVSGTLGVFIGEFKQTGGTAWVGAEGYDPLDPDNTPISGMTVVGANGGTGRYTISGGTHNFGDQMFIGSGSGSTGIYSISGTGKAQGHAIYVGNDGGAGIIMQSGAESEVWVGDVMALRSSGSYMMDDGTLNVVNFNNEGGTFVYNGGTVNAGSIWNTGSFVVNAPHLNLSGVLSQTAGILAGSGAINGDVEVYGGKVAPRKSSDPFAAFTINGSYTQVDRGILEIDLGGLEQGVSYDFLSISGQATLAGTLNVNLLSGFSLTAGDTFDILQAYGGLTNGSFFVLGVTPAGWNWTLSYRDLIGNDNVLDTVQLTASAVPIPGPVWLFGTGLLGLLGFRRRFRN